ncbi:RING-H2 finger protein ATL66-like [Rutidosis leptorrhynchoides]|uniref:RING-H2 finger protein ATL66-like n=1 Tax=Rutidosis leptorrhynchoides TaxID=125765 RepID=UPI003A99AF75
MSTEGSQSFHFQNDDLDDDNFEIKGSTLLYIIILFSIILFITICFFLYTRCVSRSRSATSSVSRISVQLSEPQGLDAATINNLPIKVYKNSEMNETTTFECSICLGGFEEEEKVKMLPNCCHFYHCECVDKWLITHTSCPVCRTKVRVDSPV